MVAMAIPRQPKRTGVVADVFIGLVIDLIAERFFVGGKGFAEEGAREALSHQRN
jgi:hypothetical protein